MENTFISGEFAPAPENANLATVPEEARHFIGGQFIAGRDHFSSINPATGKAHSQIPQATSEEVDEAVAAARRAFEGPWGKMPGLERGKFLFRIARLLQEHAREFAVLETLDGGKPIRESRDFDVPQAAAHFFYHAGWADKLSYANGGGKTSPHGVCAQVIPWNFPLLMLAWKVAPALACGNTVVLKPAETTSLTALRFAELCQEAELPPGVVNIITGNGEVGAMLTGHRGVDKVAFTGSTTVGKKLAGSVQVPLTLELGGKGANVVFEDAALDEAVEGVVNGIFFNQGHVCCAGSRLLVQEGIANQFVASLKRRMESLVVGDPMDKNTDLGAINSGGQLERIRGYLQEAPKIWQPDLSLPEGGFWCPPTLALDCAQSHRLVQEEIFGPVLAVQTFRTTSEAIAKANNTRYGLSAGVWTEKGSRAFEVSRALKAGVVWVNTFNNFDPASPFGGMMESGFGREGGLAGLSAYLKNLNQAKA